MKKGFTLIELLAVIVILAIIALIATPVVLDIIDDARKSSASNSAQLYVDGLNKYIVLKNLTGGFIPSQCVIIDEKVYCDGTEIDYKTDGKNPSSGVINFSDGKVFNYSLRIMDYDVVNKGIEVTKADGFNKSVLKGAAVYLDPINPESECNSLLASQNLNSFGTKTGINTGCMKWYIYDEDENNYKLILDHNTSGDVAWNSDGTSQIMGEVNTRLQEDTSGWIGNPRLITAQEVAHIVGADRSDTIQWDQTKEYSSTPDLSTQIHGFFLDGSGNTYSNTNGWSIQVANSTNKSKYSWLFDNLYNCKSFGCNYDEPNKFPYPNKNSNKLGSVDGYWTSSIVVGDSETKAWLVHNEGRLGRRIIADNFYHGVRPVITVSKTLVNF